VALHSLVFLSTFSAKRESRHKSTII